MIFWKYGKSQIPAHMMPTMAKRTMTGKKSGRGELGLDTGHHFSFEAR
jgi:hypothetical protein